MEIPFLSNFIEGLKLFFESKKLRWFALVFFIGAFFITIWESLGAILLGIFPGIALLVFSGGVFPIYFMLVSLMSILGLGRFVVSEESYKRSFIYTIIWGVISAFVLIAMVFLTFQLFILIFVGFTFLGWIGFQSYFATRTSLGLARSVDVGKRSLLIGLFYGVIYIFNYAVVVGAVIFGIIVFAPGLPAIGVSILGGLLALGFNFLNGLILAKERNKSTASGVAVLGLFISLYSAYFIYNVLKGFDPALDLVSIAISIAFILYTMSGIGRTLASRAELDTRFKISREFAATLTYFLASGFMFVDSVFILIIVDPSLQGVISDVIKLLLFPFIAFIMVLYYLYESRKALKEAEIISEPEVVEEEELPEVEEEPVELAEPAQEEEIFEDEDLGTIGEEQEEEEIAAEEYNEEE
ncbi:MAG: hypothetical protein AM325_012140 [Candidatus Thorarchaeota archaeon SMTZ1-45]|nr:MAG: hypothetical protein AM325_13825 [Candidatus Thorarchaeota archaeon SMTZ1-45]